MENPIASAKVIDPDIRRQAIAWYVLMNSGEATAAERSACEHWLALHPQHADAWSRLDSVRNALAGVPGNIAIPTLTGGNTNRRGLLKGGAWLALGLGSGALMWREQPWRTYMADFKTRTGEQRQFTLDDGSQLLLNTDTQIDLRFSNHTRLLHLLHGEVLIQTAADQSGSFDESRSRKASRPFEIQTAQGRIRALGTRFVVRDQQDYTLVTVLEHAVEIRLQNRSAPVRLEAGQQVRFSRERVEQPQPVSANADAWVHGQLAVNDQPLGEVITELARYRPGILRISPEASAIRVSGVFPVKDTDRTLAVLASRFPIRINATTPYWIRIELAP
ncbi:FecR domain-containing protein [Cellvibrio japonicus]|uniref:Transmembrane sensor n=1 Tax=Cellvibrio japonicus (strain Ueda107) TaxID=498211 RepID=B3PJT3_CELJU|nr:FecR domain-containing protein [Cellvibrio japonicus]ACE83574.1 transmembrane sensor [Cellvibrio japonicus Ueda107]QEI12716.1 DUF4880 domain-containing protein [Cellvibrio japonicus]QEI16290.1 DUF4880 domain-containing protein [Cellvibrio japonicus]QEI19868.1 DUF4880 domain-containing protein [Cellvibrio japonicus]